MWDLSGNFSDLCGAYFRQKATTQQHGIVCLPRRFYPWFYLSPWFCLSLPRVWLCPSLGQPHLFPATPEPLFRAVIFPPAAHFSSQLCQACLSYCDPPCLSSLRLIYHTIFLSCQTSYWLFYLPPLLSPFCPPMPFLSFLSHFMHPLLPPFFFLLWPVFYTLSCSLLSEICLQSLLCLPLYIFPPRCSFVHCPFSELPFTYRDAYRHVCVLHSRSSILQPKQRNDSCR